MTLLDSWDNVISSIISSAAEITVKNMQFFLSVPFVYSIDIFLWLAVFRFRNYFSSRFLHPYAEF